MEGHLRDCRHTCLALGGLCALRAGMMPPPGERSRPHRGMFGMRVYVGSDISIYPEQTPHIRSLSILPERIEDGGDVPS
jgi:hypothetical protein